jgi:hypothetical protein
MELYCSLEEKQGEAGRIYPSKPPSFDTLKHRSKFWLESAKFSGENASLCCSAEAFAIFSGCSKWDHSSMKSPIIEHIDPSKSEATRNESNRLSCSLLRRTF